MTRRIDAKAVLTVAVLLGVFAVALLRSNHWNLPFSWSGWRSITLKRAPSNPEDGIYAMFDAARAGDAQAYLDCFSGPLREQLAATAKEDAKFKEYLTRQNSAVQGMAVTVTDRPNPDEARVRLEYVYSDHNEVQNLHLKREGARWKIINMDGAQPTQPLVPYGTKATD
ncbi:MAG: hypothetical protein ABSF45_02630 [Terriglobia bacterium]|jgi:hypothetical protein